MVDRYKRPPNVQVAMKLEAQRYWDLVLNSIDALGRSR